MKRKKLTRILSLALSALLCLSFVPMFGSKASAASSITVTTMEGLKMALESTEYTNITLGKDITGKTNTADGQWSYIKGTKTLDLAGYDIDISYDDVSSHLLFYLSNGANLTINDSKGDGQIMYNGYINDNGTLRVRNLFYIPSGCKVTVNGGFIKAGRCKNNWVYSLAQYLDKYTFGTAFKVYGELVVNGGKIEGRGKWPETGTYCYAIEAFSGGKVTINGGEIRGWGAAPCINGGTSKFYVKGGTFLTDSSSKVYINGKGYNYFGASATGLSSATIPESEAKVTINKGTSLSDATNVTVTPKAPAFSTGTEALTVSSGTVGSAYSSSWVKTKCTTGVQPITFSVVSGVVPSGLTFSSDGVLSGTPNAAGNYTFIVKATNRAGSSPNITVHATINPKPATPITTPIAVKVTEPVVGNTVNFDLLSAPTGLTKQAVSWYQNGAGLTSGTKYTEGDCEVRVFLNVKDGYSLPSTLTGTINGNTAKVTKVSDTQIRLEYHFTLKKPSTTITTPIAITITEPKVGNTPTFQATVPTGLTRENTVWTQNGSSLLTTSKFVAGKCNLTVWLEVKDGYTLPSTLTATVNGKAATVTKKSNTEFTVSYEYNLAETKTPITTPIAVKVTEPVVGNTVNFDLLSAPTGLTKQAVSWYQNGAGLTSGTKYTEGDCEVRVFLNVKDGYSLPSTLTGTINGNTAKVTKVSDTQIRLEYHFTLKKSDTPYVFPFTDVPESAWYYQWVRKAHEMGLINGETPTLFRPLNNLTYGAAVKLAACMHQLYTTGSVTLTNGSPNWYDSYYTYCKDNGILKTSASTNTRYSWFYNNANEYISREEYVYLFANCLPDAAFAVKNTIPEGSIPDGNQIDSSYYSAVYKMYRAGILNGKNSYGTFGPGDLIDRGSVAAILARMMDPSTRVDAPANLGA